MVSQRTEVPLRALFLRILTVTFLSVAAMLPMMGAALAIENLRTYAGIVVDAKSGKVLYEDAADAARYPASVTKVMTLYILFQELQAGNIQLSDKMTVSKYAAAAVPTKLGLKAGATIAVQDAIKAIVTLSANDMARVIAEHISGSESKFAERMTATAKALGMKRTTYRNASGLPDESQRTTVRDQAILAIAIYEHFSEYYGFFQTTSFSYGKRTYGNHNNLLGRGGIDGIKTGYINAAGYNLMTAARTENRHLVVIGFGFNKAGARDSKVWELVQKYLPKARKGDYLSTAMIPQPGRLSDGSTPNVQVAQAAEPVYVEPMPLPSFRLNGLQPGYQLAVADGQATPQPVTAQQQPIAVAAIEPASQPVPADLTLQPAVQAVNQMGGAPQPAERPDVIGAWIADTYSLGAPPAPLGETLPSAPLPFDAIGANGQGIDPTTSGAIGQVGSAQPVAGGWLVQIGAPPTEDVANQLLGTATAKITGLADFRAYVERFDKNGQTFYRARFIGFGGRDDATAMCNQLKQVQMSCLAMQG